jgi:Tfp pilus assembly protein PilV
MKITRYKKQDTKNNKRGFTILETLFAIFILIMSITGPMVFAQSGLRASFQSRDQITAFYLAQDAIETIKNIRDNNLLDINKGWLDGLETVCVGSVPCTIDTTDSTPTVAVCTGGDCPPLQTFGDNNPKYGYGGGDDSRFTRTTYINKISAYEAEIIIEVEWTSAVALGSNRIVVQENIYDWFPETGL